MSETPAPKRCANCGAEIPMDNDGWAVPGCVDTPDGIFCTKQECREKGSIVLFGRVQKEN